MNKYLDPVVYYYAAKERLLGRKKISYSQSGEDIIISRLFSALGIKKPTYLDIGANDPKNLSNTYLFYKHGARGVVVEPNPSLSRRFKSIRKRDICVEKGVGIPNEGALFYDLKPHVLSTFSKDEALRYEKNGVAKIKRIINIPIVSINDLIKEHFLSAPNLISIDVEGLDFEIIQSLNFKENGPDIICIETVSYEGNNFGKKDIHLIEYIKSHGYTNYADTYINTIFLKTELWAQRNASK